MKRKQYILYTATKFLSSGIRENEYIVNHLINFVPAITIDCKPPYIAGKADSKWLKYPKGYKPNKYNKLECETRLGMSLLPIE